MADWRYYTSASKLPDNPPNGGKFTGSEQAHSGAWANIPVTPTEAHFNRMFRLHNPGVPEEVEHQRVSGHRPGNNNLDDIAGTMVLTITNQWRATCPPGRGGQCAETARRPRASPSTRI